MNKRQRKKQHRGEFATLVFRVTGTRADDSEAFMDFMFGVEAKLGWMAYGCMGKDLDFRVGCCDGCGEHSFVQTTDMERSILKNLLEGPIAVETFGIKDLVVGPLERVSWQGLRPSETSPTSG